MDKRLPTQSHSLSLALADLEDDFKRGDVSTADLLRITGSTDGLPLLTLLLGLPFCLPLPLPGVSMPFGLIIALCGFRLARGKAVTIPPRFERLRIPKSAGLKVLAVSKRFIRLIEREGPPILPVIVESHAIRLFLCFCLMLGGALLALPLPPGTNFPPGMLVAITSLALLRHSLLSLILSAICLTLNAGFFFGLWELGSAGIETVMSSFKF